MAEIVEYRRASPFHDYYNYSCKYVKSYFDFRIGVNADRKTTVDAGIVRTAYYYSHQDFLDFPRKIDYTLGCEMNLDKSNPMIAPKISYTITGLILHFGVSLLYTTDFKQGELYTRPQIGCGLWQFGELAYGYNFRLSPACIEEKINRNVFSLHIYIRYLWDQTLGFQELGSD